jgi:hypothetical protein
MSTRFSPSSLSSPLVSLCSSDTLLAINASIDGRLMAAMPPSVESVDDASTSLAFLGIGAGPAGGAFFFAPDKVLESVDSTICFGSDDNFDALVLHAFRARSSSSL